MQSYYIEVTVDDKADKEVKVFEILKGAGFPADKAKQVLQMIGTVGLMKELDGPLDTGSENEFVFYPVPQILRIRMIPELILQV